MGGGGGKEDGRRVSGVGRAFAESFGGGELRNGGDWQGDGGGAGAGRGGGVLEVTLPTFAWRMRPDAGYAIGVRLPLVCCVYWLYIVNIGVCLCRVVNTHEHTHTHTHTHLHTRTNTN